MTKVLEMSNALDKDELPWYAKPSGLGDSLKERVSNIKKAAQPQTNTYGSKDYSPMHVLETTLGEGRKDAMDILKSYSTTKPANLGRGFDPVIGTGLMAKTPKDEE